MEVTLPDLGTVAVRLRRSDRARKLRFRIDPLADGIEVVLPRGATRHVAIALLRQNADWVRTHLARLPERVAFVPGAWVPILGQDHCIRTDPRARAGVWAEDGMIHVGGDGTQCSRRVLDFMKKRARTEITPRLLTYAARLERTVARIAIRDTKSRWGSCSARGNVAFSWRLVMAPERVLEYVIAHEAAHLAELNHSPAFWRVVDRLYGPCAHERRWLKDNGVQLHRFGPALI